MSEVAELPGLPARAYDKADASPDDAFYIQPRFVTHIDDGAIAAVTALYRRTLPAGGAIIDLMSSWVSHLPAEVAYGHVTGHGMNASELDANPRLDRRIVQDLNRAPRLPLAPGSLDAACLCVSVQYLQRPVAVFAALREALRPGAPVIVSFSNRCFPTKAVLVWQALDARGQQGLVSACLKQAGFTGIETGSEAPRHGDPLYAVIGHAPGGGR